MKHCCIADLKKKKSSHDFIAAYIQTHIHKNTGATEHNIIRSHVQ